MAYKHCTLQVYEFVTASLQSVLAWVWLKQSTQSASSDSSRTNRSHTLQTLGVLSEQHNNGLDLISD